MHKVICTSSHQHTCFPRNTSWTTANVLHHFMTGGSSTANRVGEHICLQILEYLSSC
uniref:Uncharacterized protein n=1 Tax=Arundo donax TaxID=35708 RepID=A0A0A8Z5E7_ARUDO